MPRGGRLLIKTESHLLGAADPDDNLQLSPGSYLVLTVSDSGCGMPAAVRQHIFEPFFTTKEIGKGTGLGLSYVYGVVLQHSGAIRVDSEPAVGTTFNVWLPTALKPAASPVKVGGASAPGGSELVLIAEDEEMVRALSQRALEGAGYRTLVAANGLEAVRLFEQHRDSVALALLDIVMPDMGGHEVCHRIRQLAPEVPVIFCTGYDPDSSPQGDDRCQLLAKPFTPKGLLIAVRGILDYCPAGAVQ
jgi:CheY-like chemotaxis protein